MALKIFSFQKTITTTLFHNNNNNSFLLLKEFTKKKNYYYSTTTNKSFSLSTTIAPPTTYKSLFTFLDLSVTTTTTTTAIKKKPVNIFLNLEQRRYRSDFAPRKTKYRKAHKGRVPVRVGGSTKGNTIAFGEYGLRVTHGVRLTSAQLTAARNALKRKLKPIKEAELWMRVFPDIPVTAKGNEVRMGKGKGSFEYWACRVPMNKIVFEIGGGNMRREVAKDILKMASDRLPVVTEFVEIDRKVDKNDSNLKNEETIEQTI